MKNKDIWISWSNDKKNKWIAENIFKHRVNIVSGFKRKYALDCNCDKTIFCDHKEMPNYLNGNGFFKIAEKMSREYRFDFDYLGKIYGLTVSPYNKYHQAKTPIDAIVLAYMELNNITLEEQDA